MRVRPWMPLVASAAAYVVLTAIVGRDVLAGISTTVAHDAGDPVFTATLLYWNATQVPLSDAWWQLPVFYPTPDTLTFSEHLLGLSVIATPLYWLTRDPLVTYNVAMLLTFPLCALAMYALVRRLTGRAAAAFVAGLAFSFAPYRMGQLSHIQVLAVFWAPLALLGLHAYIETGRRRWLVLYGGAWLLQAASNAYMLVLLSLLVGCWVLWFVVAPRRWRALGAIAGATAIAGVPLVPILHAYLTVHARHGFERSLDEMREYSADVASVLCAPETLTFWGWLRVQCEPEAQLFPGLTVLALGVIGLVLVLQSRSGSAGLPPGRTRAVLRRLDGVVRRGLILVAGVYAAIVVIVITVGPWRLDLGVLRISATSVEKPLAIGVAAVVGWVLLAPGVRAAARGSSLLGFYVVVPIIAWILALGPTLIVMGRRLTVDAPFALLAVLPGVDGLRVPARFWLLTVLCLAVAAGIVLAHLLRGRSRPVTAAGCAVVTIVLLADGWTHIPAVAAPLHAPAPRLLAGQVVLEVPVRDGVRDDIGAQYRAVLGGWRVVNGYSGYFPSYYGALHDALSAGEDSAFVPFQRRNELHVLVHHGTPRLKALVERQPGATRTAENAWATQYRLPRRPRRQDVAPVGTRLPIVHVQSECASGDLGYVIDGGERQRWYCDLEDERQTLTIDLGDVVTVGAVVHRSGPYHWEFPRRLLIQTSEDGETWRDARNGSVLEEVIEGGLADPASLAVVLPFTQRPARYLRLRHRGIEAGVGWAVAEIEVWSGELDGG